MKFLNWPHIVGQTQEITFLNLKILSARWTCDKKQFLTISSIWNSLPDSIKKANSANTFKHNIKKHYLTWIAHNVYMWIYVSVFTNVCIYTYGYILVCFPLTYPFSCCFLFLFLFLFSHLPFSFIFILTWGTTMKIRRFFPFCAILAFVDAIHICLQ